MINFLTLTMPSTNNCTRNTPSLLSGIRIECGPLFHSIENRDLCRSPYSIKAKGGTCVF